MRMTGALICIYATVPRGRAVILYSSDGATSNAPVRFVRCLICALCYFSVRVCVCVCVCTCVCVPGKPVLRDIPLFFFTPVPIL
uniref:Putative secreted protein n=1 Tax=Anopheles marajoara TaxID=58244 RepID=A0A2M4CBJ2_9DIPT